MTKQEAQRMIDTATRNAKSEVAMNRHQNEGGEGYEHTTAADSLMAAYKLVAAAGYYVRHNGTVIDAADYAAIRPTLQAALKGCKTPAQANAKFAKIQGGWSYAEAIEAKTALVK